MWMRITWFCVRGLHPQHPIYAKIWSRARPSQFNPWRVSFKGWVCVRQTFYSFDSLNLSKSSLPPGWGEQGRWDVWTIGSFLRRFTHTHTHMIGMYSSSWTGSARHPPTCTPPHTHTRDSPLGLGKQQQFEKSHHHGCQRHHHTCNMNTSKLFLTCKSTVTFHAKYSHLTHCFRLSLIVVWIKGQHHRHQSVFAATPHAHTIFRCRNQLK